MFHFVIILLRNIKGIFYSYKKNNGKFSTSKFISIMKFSSMWQKHQWIPYRSSTAPFSMFLCEKGKRNAGLKEAASEVRKGVHSWQRNKNPELQKGVKKKDHAGMQQMGL